jgi:hypothetical protein
MLTAVKYLFYTIIVAGITSFMVLSSIVFGEKEVESTLWYMEQQSIQTYVIQEQLNSENKKTLQYTNISTKTPDIIDKNSALYVEFWRLASAFLLPSSIESSLNMLSVSGSKVKIEQSSPMIIALYDPFSTYSIHSASGDYSIDQITNGSFYIGNEANNTVSIYSIDSVIKLNFLHGGEHMADLVLFPGMYVRFNPSFNRIFKWVTDPFRVAQVVSSDDTSDTSGTTGIEFVNPRMENADNTDTFFMYRLPPSTRILFRMLHTMFHDKVAQVDSMKSYATELMYSSESMGNPWLKNPSKVNHFLLLDLKATLSQWLQSQTNIDTFTQKIQSIREKAETLAIGNSVEKTFQQFLTDGRFALFGTSVSANYEKIYKDVALIVGIAPSTGKARLFQKLSDIYSHNLVTQKKDLTFSKIDTYSPTAIELETTLSSTDIEHKDFFDIALYAFSILEKARNGQFFESQAMTSHATYQLISTIFTATSKYAWSVDDTEQRNKNYRSIALHFYEPLLRVYVHSLYYFYTTVEDGNIFLNERALTAEGKLKMGRDLIRDIKTTDTTIRAIVAESQAAYQKETDLTTILSIKRSLIRMRAFSSILQDDIYTNYLLSPYVATSEGDISLPKLSDDDTAVVVDDGVGQ